MNKLIVGAFVALCLLTAGLGYRVHSLTQENAVLAEASNQAAEALKRTRAVLRTREAEIASQARKFAQAQEGLSQALQAEKPWSDTHVPDTIQEALRGAVPDPADGVQYDNRGESPAAPGVTAGLPGAAGAVQH